MKKIASFLKRHKIITILAAVIIFLWSQMCFLPWILRLILGPFDPGIESMKMGEQVLELFDERDKEGLKSLFSNKIREYEDLDTQIEEAFAFFEGNITEYPEGLDYIGGGSSRIFKNRRIVKFWLGGGVEDIATTANKTYEFNYDYYFSYERNEDWEGMMDITISDGESEVVVGRYYNLRE